MQLQPTRLGVGAVPRPPVAARSGNFTAFHVNSKAGSG